MSRTAWASAAIACAGICMLAPAAGAQAVSMYTVVDLALRNSPQVKMAEAEVRRASSGLAEAKDAYVPSFVFNSNIGYSYGFPVGQPSVLNGQSNSLVFSFSQSDYIRSARAATEAARLSLKDTRQKVILEAVLDYVELDTDERELAELKAQQEFGEKLIAIEEDRVAAGVDSRADATQSRLDNARLALRQLQVEGNAEVLAAKLAHMDGMPYTRLATSSASIPAPPDAATLAEITHESSSVASAYMAAKSKLYVSFGDDRQEYRPTLALGLNYSRYAEFNNYQNYYLRFQHNNFGIGLNITIPVFDQTKHEHAKGSAAEAVRALAQADYARDQQSEAQLALEKSLRTLEAQQTVAELQKELAEDQVSAVAIQLQNGTGNPGAAPVTPKEDQLAHINQRRYAIELLDANFQLLQAKLNLLRMKGMIENWALQIPRPEGN